MDAIASIFVNYHEERRELVEKTEAADLIEQNVAELMQLCYRGASAASLKFEFSRPAPRAVPRARPAGRGPPSLRRARASPVIPGAQACSTRPRTCSRRPCSATARRLDAPARACSGGGGGVWRARARASDCTDTSFAPAGTEWKDDASAEDEGRSRAHL